MWLFTIQVVFLFSIAHCRPLTSDFSFDHFGNGDEDSLKILKEWVETQHLKRFLPKDGELFEGDMVMSPLLRRAVLGAYSKRSALIEIDHKWKNAVVPYELDSSLTTNVLLSIKKAIKEYDSFTCIRFIPRTTQKDFVLFKSELHKCSSSVGKIGGQQNITLGPGCHRLGTVLHEMMHALGIVHEQSRPDRDDHIEVLSENVDSKYMHNFRKYDFYDVTNLNVPYNFASVMHYTNTAFSKNGEPTLKSLHFPRLKFGQRKMFSNGDIAQINRLYSCDSIDDMYAKKRKGYTKIRTENDGGVIPDTFDNLIDGSYFNF